MGAVGLSICSAEVFHKARNWLIALVNPYMFVGSAVGWERHENDFLIDSNDR